MSFAIKFLLKERTILEILQKDGASLATYSSSKNENQFVCDNVANSVLLPNPTEYSIHINTHCEYYFIDFDCRTNNYYYRHFGSFKTEYFSYGNKPQRIGVFEVIDSNL